MPFNQDAAALFVRIGQMLELLGSDPFRVNAANKAARELKGLTVDLEPLAKASDTKALTAIEGIGKGTATKLIELATAGVITEHDELMTKVPAGLMEILSIQGLGPKTVKLMWNDLDIESTTDLKAAIDNRTIMSLPRMGAKTVENIADSIAFLESTGKRIQLGIAKPLADRFVNALAEAQGASNVCIVGSLRRGQETVGDIDILIATANPAAAFDVLTSDPSFVRTLTQTDSRLTVLVSIESTPNRWGDEEDTAARINLYITNESAWAAALIYYTGSKEHTNKLRARAADLGFSLTESKLTSVANPDEPIAQSTEVEIYNALKLPFIPPTLREDRGEFELTEPVRLVEVADIKADLHTHTTETDGKLTLEESATLARDRGFHTLAITDHSQSSVIVNGLKPDRLYKQIETIHAFNDQFDGLHIIAGSEVDILTDGTLDYDDELLNALDIVVASPHAGLRAKPKQATKRLLKIIAHPSVHIIGHPTGRLIQKRAGLEPDMDELIAAAVEHDVAFEINTQWKRLDLRDTHVHAAVEAGCKIAINGDVHHAGDYDHIIYGILTGQRGWLTPELCINTWDHDKLHTWLKSKR